MGDASKGQRIYLSPPDVRGRERELLLDALESNWIAPLGPHVNSFEREIASYAEVASAAAVSSGTAALHLALKMLEVGAGDTVVVSTLTFVASANAVAYLGAEPVFVDSETRTWNMCPERLQEALELLTKEGRKPKAIIVVDLYGQCADYDRILEVASCHDVPVIEDAAEALGARYRGKPAGGFGAMSVFSFNGNKIITTSGGGMLVSGDPSYTDRARHLATQARLPVAHYEHEEIGYNYRLSNLLAAVGRAQLETLDERIAARGVVKEFYRTRFADVDGLTFMPSPDGYESNNWLSCVLVDGARFGATRDAIIQTLDEANIEARPVWKPMHMQPVFSKAKVVGGKVAETLFETGLCLPSGSDLTRAQLELIAELTIDRARQAA